MVQTFKKHIEEKLRDFEFTKGYGESLAKNDFALTLCEARNKYGLTQDDLAKSLGFTQSYIAKLERGDANPTIGVIGKIFAIMGLRLTVGVAPLVESFYEMIDKSQTGQMPMSKTYRYSTYSPVLSSGKTGEEEKSYV